MSLLDTFLEIDKIAAREFLGERRGRTVSRVAGSRIARAAGTDVQTGTDIFHAVLLGGLVVGGLALAGAASPRTGRQ